MKLVLKICLGVILFDPLTPPFSICVIFPSLPLPKYFDMQFLNGT